MPAGRPPKTETDTRQVIIESIRLHDSSVEDAAAVAGINERTVYRWQNEDPDFCQAIKEARAESRNYYRNGLRQLVAEGNPAATIFGCKAIVGMKETQVVEHGTADDNDEWLQNMLGDEEGKVGEVLARRGNGGGNGNGGDPNA